MSPTSVKISARSSSSSSSRAVHAFSTRTTKRFSKPVASTKASHGTSSRTIVAGRISGWRS